MTAGQRLNGGSRSTALSSLGCGTCLKSSSTACGKVWKLLLRLIWVPSTMAIFPNIYKTQSTQLRDLDLIGPYTPLLLSLTFSPHSSQTPFPQAMPAPKSTILNSF